jgi:hypothetical protein
MTTTNERNIGVAAPVRVPPNLSTLIGLIGDFAAARVAEVQQLAERYLNSRDELEIIGMAELRRRLATGTGDKPIVRGFAGESKNLKEPLCEFKIGSGFQ